MVNVKELMIGNWVLCDGNYLKIDSISNYPNDEYKTISAKGAHLEGEFKFKRLDPIPLTPELLEKCGFDGEWSDGFLKQKNNGVGQYFIKIEDDVRYYWMFGKTDKIELKSLHQLQNLYFALTNEELTTTL